LAKKKNTQTQKNPLKNEIYYDYDAFFDKYFWIIIPVLTLIYFISSRYSTGFYMDDEIGNYINVVRFWHSPSDILGSLMKPGYKIFMVIPAYFGYDYVLIANSLYAALTVYLLYKLLRIYKLQYAYLGAILLAFQPLFFDLSFRSYPDIFTGLLIILLIIFYKKENYYLTALTGSYIFLVRQEFSIFCLFLAIVFIMKKKYLPVLFFGVFPLIYNFLGFLKTGDIYYLFSDLSSVTSISNESQGFWHYFKVYIFIVGPVSLSLFLLGFLGFFNDTKKFKEYISRYDIIFGIFVFNFTFYTVIMLLNGPNPGNWRYLLHISPLCAFISVVGFNNFLNPDFKKTHLIITGSFVVITLLFLSRKSNGWVFLDGTDYTKFIFVLIFLLLTVFFLGKYSKTNFAKLSFASIILALIFFGVNFESRKLSPENVMIKNVAEYLSTITSKDKKILANHNTIFFFDKTFRNNVQNTDMLNLHNLAALKKGSVVIWENHYGYRPEYKFDVKLETITNDSAYKVINQFSSSDKRYNAYIFEKVKD
jgi:hypothetical protein